MRKTLALMAVVLTLGLTAGFDAEAKRLGGGRSSGMQRSTVTAPASTGPAATAAPSQAPVAGSAATATAPAAAATAKRSWMGPLAGIAAGLGIAALASHFGFGEALANMLTIALLAMLAMAVIGMVLRKRAAAQGGAFAAAGAGRHLPDTREQAPGAFRSAEGSSSPGGSLIGSRLATGAGVASTGTGSIPPGFDTAAFERAARDQFMALQAANDARDLNRLRDYLTPEMFEAASAEVRERGGAPQETQVFGLEAQVLDVAEEGASYVVSVRFRGSVRTDRGAATEDLDEVWHLTKPRAGFGGWVVAGIQQRS